MYSEPFPFAPTLLSIGSYTLNTSLIDWAMQWVHHKTQPLLNSLNDDDGEIQLTE